MVRSSQQQPTAKSSAAGLAEIAAHDAGGLLDPALYDDAHGFRLLVAYAGDHELVLRTVKQASSKRVRPRRGPRLEATGGIELIAWVATNLLAKFSARPHATNGPRTLSIQPMEPYARGRREEDVSSVSSSKSLGRRAVVRVAPPISTSMPSTTATA
jgi:hypothetical protein